MIRTADKSQPDRYRLNNVLFYAEGSVDPADIPDDIEAVPVYGPPREFVMAGLHPQQLHSLGAFLAGGGLVAVGVVVANLLGL